MKQATLQSAVTLSGKGLHTGQNATATLIPAEVNHGIRFRRVDLPQRPEMMALACYVGKTTRGTVLEQPTWSVSTIEHLMAALYAAGITNCTIEVNAPEVPILDGSAKLWIEAIRQAGIQTQNAEADEWIVTRPIRFEQNKQCTMIIEPSERFEVHVQVDYPSPVLGKQEARLTDIQDFDSQIAAARTFCFLREIRPLLNLGLIRGGDLQNALVIYDKRMWQWTMNRLARKLGQPPVDASRLGYLTPLLYENEPARHKLLDLIGDLSLIGRHIRGKITATCPGHGFNTYCAKQLLNYR